MLGYPMTLCFKQNLLIEGVTYCKSLVIPVTEFISFYKHFFEKTVK